MTVSPRAVVALACICVGAGSSVGAQARTSPPTKDSALVVYDDDGLRVHSADGKKQIKMKAYVLAEYRALLSDTSDAVSNGLGIKRSRVFFDVNVNPWIAGRLMFDVGPPSSTSPIQDAYVDVGLGGSWWLRAGKQKTPMGIERYMSISAQLLPDRSAASMLTGSRDVGIQVTGEVGKHLELSAGVYNGVPDGSGTQDFDPNDGKDLTWRVWWKPLRTKVRGVEQGFGLAYNGTSGIERSPAVAGARLPTFRTIGGSPYFSYLESGGVRAAGRHTRNGAFTYLHRGRVGTFAEWLGNSQVVTRNGSTATIATGGWVANLQVNLTGELSAQEGVTPQAAFDPGRGDWGAFQVGVRAAQVRVDDAAFPLFANPATAARGAMEIGVGLNWYITRLTKMQLAYEHTTFDGGAALGDRKAERLIQLRWQAYF